MRIPYKHHININCNDNKILQMKCNHVCIGHSMCKKFECKLSSRCLCYTCFARDAHRNRTFRGCHVSSLNRAQDHNMAKMYLNNLFRIHPSISQVPIFIQRQLLSISKSNHVFHALNSRYDTVNTSSTPLGTFPNAPIIHEHKNFFRRNLTDICIIQNYNF